MLRADAAERERARSRYPSRKNGRRIPQQQAH